MGKKLRLPKLAVKLNGAEIKLEGLINVLENKNAIFQSVMPLMIAEIYNQMIMLQTEVTPTPVDAKRLYESMIRNRTATYSPASSSDHTNFHYRADPENIQNFFNAITVSGDKITLPTDVPVVRMLRIVPDSASPTGYTFTRDPHIVNYVKVHLGGFSKYVGRYPYLPRFHRMVAGRDVVYTAMARSIATLRTILTTEVRRVLGVP